MRKLYTLYEGPYRIRMAIRSNAYVIENLRGFTKGVYNARQIRPHRRAKWKLRNKQREHEEDNREEASTDSNGQEESQLMETESSYQSNSSMDTLELFRPRNNQDDTESETDTVASLTSVSESEIQPIMRTQEHIQLKDYI